MFIFVSIFCDWWFSSVQLERLIVQRDYEDTHFIPMHKQSDLTCLKNNTN